jgi:radical SAM superfamily enzyme YgiQ (UPF0313 family)
MDIFDALVHGDADMAITRLADLAYGDGDLSDVPNLLFRARALGNVRRTRREYADMATMPMPTYDPAVYDTSGKILIPVVEDSRSCDNACMFCVQPRIGGKRRVRDIEQVLAEVERDRTEYGWTVFRLSGPKPTSGYVNALAQALPEDARFTAFGYADQHYEDAVASGRLIGLFTGLESTDARILEKAYRKTGDTEAYLAAAREMVRLFKRQGLANVVSMIVPSPDETEASMRKSLEFLIETAPDFVPCLPIGPMPGTPLTRMAAHDPERAGVMLDDDYAFRLMHYETDLLRPPASWPEPPWQVRVDGWFVRNAMHLLSDEQVLMAHLYHGGLSKDQEERRRQCVAFNATARAAIAEGDTATLRTLIETINRRGPHGDEKRG